MEGLSVRNEYQTEACRELGIDTWPKIIRLGLSEEEKWTHARKLNIARRHLNRDQKQQLIRDQLIQKPGDSDRVIAMGLGVDHKTIGAQREELARRGEIPHVEHVIDTLGRKQPRKRNKPARYLHDHDTQEGRRSIIESARVIIDLIDRDRLHPPSPRVDQYSRINT